MSAFASSRHENVLVWFFARPHQPQILTKSCKFLQPLINERPSHYGPKKSRSTLSSGVSKTAKGLVFTFSPHPTPPHFTPQKQRPRTCCSLALSRFYFRNLTLGVQIGVVIVFTRKISVELAWISVFATFLQLFCKVLETLQLSCKVAQDFAAFFTTSEKRLAKFATLSQSCMFAASQVGGDPDSVFLIPFSLMLRFM